MRKDWKRRFFVVSDGILKYYKSGKVQLKIETHPKDLNPITAINLLLCSVKVRADIDRRCCFEIISPEKRFPVHFPDKQLYASS